MEEPTVLDYVKSKIFFWRSEKIEIPPAEASGLSSSGDSWLELDVEPATSVEPVIPVEPEP